MDGNELKTLKTFLKIESGLTEEMIAYISRKTGLKMNVVRKVLDAESEYAGKCLKKKGRVNVLGKCILYFKDKGKGNYHITAKAPKRLYNVIDSIKDEEIDIVQNENNVALKQITFIE